MHRAGERLNTRWEKLQQFLFLLLVMSLPWPIRITSALTILFVLSCLIPMRKLPSLDLHAIRIAGLCAVYFLLHVLFWGMGEGFSLNHWPEVEKKLALLIFPVLLLNSNRNNLLQQPGIFIGYVLSVATACLFCLGFAIKQYGFDLSVDGWFYHAFCKPIQQHAVYFSFQILIAIILLEKLLKHKIPVIWQVQLFALFGFTLLLLSSKLMLAAMFVCIALWGWKAFRESATHKAIYPVMVMLMLLLLAFGGSQIRSRFNDIQLNRLVTLDQRVFVPTTYFDGLSLRMLQLKFAVEILRNEQAWLFGVGPFKSQEMLDQAYRNAQMYIGQDGKGGYLGLNFHNQYAETLVRFGLMGLMVLLFLMGYLLIQAFRSGNEPFTWVWLLLMIFFFTESVIETHRGLMAMLVLPLLLFTLKFNEQPKYEM
ncbi:MAG: O-antigen ligase family protein [Bacteroidia bacterium]|jgi:O-antigen ligase